MGWKLLTLFFSSNQNRGNVDSIVHLAAFMWKSECWMKDFLSIYEIWTRKKSIITSDNNILNVMLKFWWFKNAPRSQKYHLSMNHFLWKIQVENHTQWIIDSIFEQFFTILLKHTKNWSSKANFSQKISTKKISISRKMNTYFAMSAVCWFKLARSCNCASSCEICSTKELIVLACSKFCFMYCFLSLSVFSIFSLRHLNCSALSAMICFCRCDWSSAALRAPLLSFCLLRSFSRELIRWRSSATNWELSVTRCKASSRLFFKAFSSFFIRFRRSSRSLLCWMRKTSNLSSYSSSKCFFSSSLLFWMTALERRECVSKNPLWKRNYQEKKGKQIWFYFMRFTDHIKASELQMRQPRIQPNSRDASKIASQKSVASSSIPLLVLIATEYFSRWK